MVGANYMGGKRNAAKARSRDKTGRIQKDFFGRRRLNILSKGLAAAPRSRGQIAGGSVPATRASIELGHAKNVTAAQEKPISVTGKHKRDCFNVPTVSSSPGSKITARTGSSSIKSTKSKLLQELDFIEPHAAISCILAMDDLAGLRPSPDKRTFLDSSQRSPSPVSSCDSDFVLNDEEEDPIMEYESVSGFGYQSSISSGSGNASSRQNECQYRRSDNWFQQDPLETEYMRDIDPDQDHSSSSKVFGSPRVSSLRRRSSYSRLAQLSGASWKDESSSSLYGSNFRDRFVHHSSRSGVKRRFVGNNILPKFPNPSAQLIDPDIGEQMEAIYPNILDYSDPWEQIGVIMGLQANDNKDYQILLTSQEGTTAEDERDIEKQAALESDLPPSDIMEESSLDETLYSPSSLPIAESSASIWPRLDKACVLPEVDSEDIWPVDFDDWAVGLKESRYDESFHDVFAGDNGSAVIGCGYVTGPFQLEEQQGAMEDIKNSDAAGSHPPTVEDVRSTLAEECVMPSPHDSMDCVEDVLAVPELLECNGVYQGPCLLSQSFELDEE